MPDQPNHALLNTSFDALVEEVRRRFHRLAAPKDPPNAEMELNAIRGYLPIEHLGPELVPHAVPGLGAGWITHDGMAMLVFSLDPVEHRCRWRVTNLNRACLYCDERTGATPLFCDSVFDAMDLIGYEFDAAFYRLSRDARARRDQLASRDG